MSGAPLADRELARHEALTGITTAILIAPGRRLNGAPVD